MTVSLCMIVKDEETVLARCLDSVKDCTDEIIIVDTGSTDGTVGLARRYTDRVYSFPWKDDFSAARNFAFSKAKCDYLLWLDADDRISPDSADGLLALKSELDTARPDIVFCPYDAAFDSEGKPTLTYYRERLIRREANLRFVGRVHECIPPQGKTLYADCRVSHLGSPKPRGMRNLHIYQRWAGEETLGGRDLFYYGRELYYHKLYTESVAVLEEMLAGEGWYVNKIEACKILARCHRECGRPERAYGALLRSFLYGEPRASLLCEIGNLLKSLNRMREAAYWYEAALACRDHSEEGDFEEPACKDLIPMLELTCCYFALDERDTALEWHERAKERFPSHPSVLYNDSFFATLRQP
ncbi:MAG: glycosyltransferase family 2 protein [Clostridia bacterium]|nr:glycosyltransferase family 2 protein [Clostridia bacterium]